MKKLILIRHASAEMTGECGDDFGRLLTDIGRKESIILANKLARVNLSPGIIISSPAPRALETANLVAEIIGFPVTNIRQDKSIYQENSPRDLLHLLDSLDESIHTAMLVGHNPTLSHFAWFLCTRFRNNIQKASAVGFGFEISAWASIVPGRANMLFYLTTD